MYLVQGQAARNKYRYLGLVSSGLGLYHYVNTLKTKNNPQIVPRLQNLTLLKRGLIGSLRPTGHLMGPL